MRFSVVLNGVTKVYRETVGPFIFVCYYGYVCCWGVSEGRFPLYQFLFQTGKEADRTYYRLQKPRRSSIYAWNEVKGQRFIPGHTGCKVTMKIQNRLAKEHRWFNRTESESGTDKSNDKCLSLLQGLLEWVVRTWERRESLRSLFAHAWDILALKCELEHLKVWGGCFCKWFTCTLSRVQNSSEQGISVGSSSKFHGKETWWRTWLCGGGHQKGL